MILFGQFVAAVFIGSAILYSLYIYNVSIFCVKILIHLVNELSMDHLMISSARIRSLYYQTKTYKICCFIRSTHNSAAHSIAMTIDHFNLQRCTSQARPGQAISQFRPSNFILIFFCFFFPFLFFFGFSVFCFSYIFHKQR